MAARKKRVTATAAKTVTPMAEVKELKTCIAQCESKLVKVCGKAKSQLDKQLTQAQTKLSKARAKLKVARERLKTAKADQKIKKGKAVVARVNKAAEAAKTLKAEFQALQQAVQTLKVDKAEIKAEAQQLSARQKALQQFNKTWAKAQKEKITIKRNKRKKVSVTNPLATTI
ncbi:MAG: hypothetical protein GY821_13695 [Gammaproteobacteria bacterium]|nr:hypothetical protein [Gammaproteobacteria bacterium]